MRFAAAWLPAPHTFARFDAALHCTRSYRTVHGYLRHWHSVPAHYFAYPYASPYCCWFFADCYLDYIPFLPGSLSAVRARSCSYACLSVPAAGAPFAAATFYLPAAPTIRCTFIHRALPPLLPGSLPVGSRRADAHRSGCWLPGSCCYYLLRTRGCYTAGSHTRTCRVATLPCGSHSLRCTRLYAAFYPALPAVWFVYRTRTVYRTPVTYPVAGYTRYAHAYPLLVGSLPAVVRSTRLPLPHARTQFWFIVLVGSSDSGLQFQLVTPPHLPVTSYGCADSHACRFGLPTTFVLRLPARLLPGSCSSFCVLDSAAALRSLPRRLDSTTRLDCARACVLVLARLYLVRTAVLLPLRLRAPRGSHYLYRTHTPHLHTVTPHYLHSSPHRTQFTRTHTPHTWFLGSTCGCLLPHWFGLVPANGCSAAGVLDGAG